MARRLEKLFDRYRRRGDVSALAAVFDRTAAEILRVATHLSREETGAEDLLQETFLTAIERADTYDFARPLVPWLLGILRNHARHARRPRGMVASELVAEPETWDRDPIDAVPWTEVASAAIAALPDPFRQVLVLRLKYGLEPAAIAEVVGVPPATARSRLHRGLERLRARLPQVFASALVLPSPRGLAALREHVLAKAASTTAAPASAAALATGGALMTKKAVGAVVLSCVVLAGSGALLAGILSRGGESRRLASDPPESPGAHEERVGQSPGLASSSSSLRPSPAGEDPVEVPPTGPAPVAADAPISPGKGSVVGRLTLRDGTPLVDAPVSLWGSTPQVARTDASGAFHLHDEWVAERALYVKEADYSVSLLPVRMVADQRVDVEATIDRGVDVEGRLVAAETLAPLAGVAIAVRRPEAQAAQGGFAFAKTDADGRYRFRYLPAVPYTVEANLAGYQPTVWAIDLSSRPWPDRLALPRARRLTLRLEGAPADAIGEVLSWSMSRVGSTLRAEGRAIVSPQSEAQVEAPMPGRYRLNIRRSQSTPAFEGEIDVTEDLAPVHVPMALAVGRLSGILRWTDGEPVSGARVSWNDGGTTTDAKGRFDLPRVAAGSQPLWIGGPESLTALAHPEVIEGAEETVSLRCSRSVVEGRVTIAGARPGAHGASVHVTSAQIPGFAARAKPDETGLFRVSCLAPGEYLVIASGGDVRPESRGLTVVAEERIDLGTIDLRPYERVPLRVESTEGKAPGVVSVRAFDAVNPSLSARVTVGASIFGLQPFVARDDRGYWLRGLPPGSYRLVFEAEGYAATETIMEIEPGHARPVDVRLVRR